MKKKSKFLVSVELPEGASPKDMEQYIREAIKTWIGSKETSHPLSSLRRSSVTVRERN